jgi:hypothetical protein
MLWGDETPRDPARTLRQRRWRAREELRRLAPDLDGEPMPTDASRNTSQVYSLNPAVVCSDVHLFLELTQRAKSLTGTEAINAYEEAVALYRGDLLDASDVPTLPVALRWRRHRIDPPKRLSASTSRRAPPPR